MNITINSDDPVDAMDITFIFEANGSEVPTNEELDEYERHIKSYDR